MPQSTLAQFEPAVVKTLHFEGGFVQVAATGECANLGITQWFLRGVGLLAPAASRAASAHEVEFIKAITPEFARAIYRKYFWDPQRCGELKDQYLASKLFELSVNMGAAPAARCFQEAINRSIWPSAIAVDATIGPKTIAAANSVDAAVLLERFRETAAARYRAIASASPALAVDLPGWLARLAA